MQTQQTYISEWSKLRPANWVYSDITFDVWWRPKMIDDFSTFHGLFTYDIPPQLWLTFEDWVEVATSTRVTSVNGSAIIKSGATLWNTWFLRSKRHPRYQPNRWQLFSTAWFLPSPSAIGIRQIGFKNTITGVYFQLEDWVLYAVILNDSLEKEMEEDEKEMEEEAQKEKEMEEEDNLKKPFPSSFTATLK